MIGAASLVPPTIHQLPSKYTRAPVCGSASADTSVIVRCAHPLSVCHTGFAELTLQPLPAPLHAVSVAFRDVLVGFCCSEVPPTATTFGELAGNCVPNPSSPELKTIATPGWLKYAASSDP